MSLFGHGANNQVQVVLREMRKGTTGHLSPVEVGRVLVWGRLQQSSTDDISAVSASGDQAVLNLKRFYCRDFPGDDLSLVVDGEGVTYQVVGEPKRHRGSRGTARDSVLLRQQSVKRGIRDGI